MSTERIINSVLDTDLYKLTMQNFVHACYPNVPVEYELIVRKPFEHELDIKKFAENLEIQVGMMSQLCVSNEEIAYLKSLNLFSDLYLEWLQRNFKFYPDDIHIEVVDGCLKVKVASYFRNWERLILWETPLMAMISELRSRMSGLPMVPLSYSVNSYKKIVQFKQHELYAFHAFPTEFGTRRRFSYDAQKHFLLTAINVCGAESVSTSNVKLAMELGVRPVGTMAHELFMALSSVRGTFVGTNANVLCDWSNFYKGKLGIALTDTWTSKAFFNEFDGYFARLYDGIRHDSGDVFAFCQLARDNYRKHGIDPKTKKVVFSDGISSFDKVYEIVDACKFNDLIPSFAVGTWFTHDVDELDPMNIVIKLTKANCVGTVKLSDNIGKALGSRENIERCKKELDIA